MTISLTFPDGGAFVVGGTGRVGEGVTRQLAAAGVPTVFTYRGNSERATALEAELRDSGAKVSRCHLDLGETASIDAAIALCQRMHGRLHTVAFAGGPMISLGNIADMSPEVAGQFLTEDALGFFRVVSRVVPVLRSSGGGTITICTTVAIRLVIEDDGLSPMSKAAVEAIMRQLAVEEAKYKIRSNAVAVSWVDTRTADEQIEFFENLHSPEGERVVAMIKGFKAKTPLGGPARPEEVGNLFAFLASNQASYITGQSFAFDGGLSL